MMNSKIVIGSRKSELAMVQTHWVKERLIEHHRNLQVEIVGISTIGDKNLEVSLQKIGEKSVFTKELEHALEEGEVDLVVHSLKDIPSKLPHGMTLAAICQREDPSDVVVMRSDISDRSLGNLAEGSIIGTSSVRRTAQLRVRFPSLVFRSIRGNLNTRMRKLESGDGEVKFSAIVLAAAGLKRLGWTDRISNVLQSDVCMHAAGQGALAVECLSTNTGVLELVHCLRHMETTLCCVAERAVLRQLDGGCSAPVAVHANLQDNQHLCLSAGTWSLDGQQKIVLSDSCTISDLNNVKDIKEDVGSGDVGVVGITGVSDRRFCDEYVGVYAGVLSSQMAEAENLGDSLARRMLEQGAGTILSEAKRHSALSS